eukprot:755854-Prorocentrum_minimum.AAC.1
MFCRMLRRTHPTADDAFTTESATEMSEPLPPETISEVARFVHEVTTHDEALRAKYKAALLLLAYCLFYVITLTLQSDVKEAFRMTSTAKVPPPTPYDPLRPPSTPSDPPCNSFQPSLHPFNLAFEHTPSNL